MSEPVILIEREAGLALVTLNRPKAMNALSAELRSRLVETMMALDADPEIGVVVLTGSGRAFSAGLDLKELGASEQSILSVIEDNDPVKALARFKGPVIGAINGFAITGGFELALACDVLVCSTEAQFADTHGRVGIVPAWGLSQKLSRAVGIYRAKEISLTGNFLSAQQAYEWGLVNRVVAPAELLPTAKALARDMLSLVPGFAVTYKSLIDGGFARPFGEAMGLEEAQSKAGNRGVTAADVENRRLGVQARGKSQAER